MSWVPTWKALPTRLRNLSTGGVRRRWRKLGHVFRLSLLKWILSLTWSRWCVPVDTRLLKVYYGQSESGLFPFCEKNDAFSCMDEMKFRRTVSSSLKELSAEQKPRKMGRLGQVVEGGGKSLLFAIGNYLNQRLLHPLHVWVAEVLRRLPQDGTFNQTQPFDRLVGSRHSFSFDLKLATDRWPLVFLFWGGAVPIWPLLCLKCG